MRNRLDILNFQKKKLDKEIKTKRFQENIIFFFYKFERHEYVSILLRHSGIWENDIVYIRHKSNEIVVGDNILFVNLKAVIAAELRVDEQRKKLLIRYVLVRNSSPITIRNNRGVMLYVEVKKKESSFDIYPLCIDIVDLTD